LQTLHLAGSEILEMPPSSSLPAQLVCLRITIDEDSTSGAGVNGLERLTSKIGKIRSKRDCQYPVTGVPHPPVSRKQTWEGESRPHLKGWAAGHKGLNSSGRTTAADPLPTRERVRCRHVSLKRGAQYWQQEPRTPSRVRDLHVPPGPLNVRGAALRQGVGAATCPALRVRARVFCWKTRPPTVLNAGS